MLQAGSGSLSGTLASRPTRVAWQGFTLEHLHFNRDLRSSQRETNLHLDHSWSSSVTGSFHTFLISLACTDPFFSHLPDQLQPNASRLLPSSFYKPVLHFICYFLINHIEFIKWKIEFFIKYVAESWIINFKLKKKRIILMMKSI